MSQSATPDGTLWTMIEGIARVCLDPRFDSLRSELEAHYAELGAADPRTEAFKDAYYALVQEGAAPSNPVRTDSTATAQTPDPQLAT